MFAIYNDSWLTRRSFVLPDGQQLACWEYRPKGKSAHTALFLHGMKGEHAGMAALALRYRQMHPSATIVIPDLPGYGVSAPFPEATHATIWRLYTHCLQQLIAQLNTPTVLIGHSLGATLAYIFLSSYKKSLVTKAYLFAPQVDGRHFNTRLLGMYAVVAQLLPTVLNERLLYNRLLNRAENQLFIRTHDARVRQGITKARRAELEFRQPRVLTATFGALAHTNLCVLPRPHVPLYFICGKKDNVISLESLRRLAHKNNAPLYIVPEVGHYLVNEDALRSAQVFADDAAVLAQGVVSSI